MSDTTYGVDLDKIKVELAHRRSEMANLAKQTVADLEPKIPVLQAKINTLTAEVSRLDTLIATKTKQSEYDEEYWRTHYEELEAKLNKAHDARTALFKSKDEVYAGKDKEYADKEVNFKSREDDIQDALRRLTALDKELDEKQMDFEQEKSTHEEKTRNSMSNLNGHINEANAEKLKQKEITANLEIQSTELAKATKEAQDIIKKINDAQIILDEANKVSSDNEKQRLNLISEQEKLNELNSQHMAKLQEILNNQDALDVRERKLFQREQNVKVAEASLKR